MTAQGTPLATLFELEEIELIAPLALGDLTVPFEMESVDEGITSIISNRFPVPPTAGGFLTTVDFEPMVDGVMSPYIIAGALFPESPYLEPTTGQIWPRTG